MADIRQLRRLMRELEDQLVVCMRCGMCQAVCPVFTQTGREADVARGKLVLLDGLMQAVLNDPEAVRERLQRCLLCGSCAANCPSGVNVLEIFLKARAVLAGYLGLPPLKKAIFRRLLAHPKTMDRLVEFGAVFQNLFTRPVNEIVGTSCARFASPLLADRHFRTLAAVPLHRRHPFLNTPAGRSELKVGFFVGCLIDKIFPNVAEAALKVLEHHGVGVFLPAGQGCCGIPAVSSGDTRTFNDLVRYHLDKFDAVDFEVLVTCCATCTSTIKKIWPSLCDPELATRAQALAGRTMDISQFVVQRVKPAAAPVHSANGRVVTFHDSCHLKKSLGVFSEPRDLIRANPDYALTEMPAADDCCGMGGSFNLEHYGLSARIGRLKRDNIATTGCAAVATGCPACMLQISDMLSQAGDRIAVKHPVEIYAESIQPDVEKRRLRS